MPEVDVSLLKVSFAVWEQYQECPHCGSGEIEYEWDGWDTWAVCDACLKTSAFALDEIDTLINSHYDDWLFSEDRFDILDIFERDMPGGE